MVREGQPAGHIVELRSHVDARADAKTLQAPFSGPADLRADVQLRTHAEEPDGGNAGQTRPNGSVNPAAQPGPPQARSHIRQESNYRASHSDFTRQLVS